MDPFDFLQQVSAHTENKIDQLRPRLGFVDYDYNPSRYPQVKPRIVLDGEGLTKRGYRCISSYVPIPGDRVVLMQVGTSLVILGSVDRNDESTILRPGQLVFQGFQTVSQTIPSYDSTVNTIIALDWDTVTLDLVGGWSENDNPSQFRPNVPGWYEFNGASSLESTDHQSYRNVVWFLNGSIADGSGSRALGNTSSSNFSTQISARTRTMFLDGDSDYVELRMYQNTSTSLDTQTSLNEYYPSIEVKFVGSSGGMNLRILE